MNYQADVETSVFVISCWCLDSSKRSWLRNLQASFCIQNYFTEVNSRQHLSANTVQSRCCWWWAKQLPFSLKSNSSAVYLLVSVQLRPLQQTVMHLYYTLWPLNKLVEFSLTYYIQSQPESLLLLHCESKKTRHQTLCHNFTNYYPIFNFFSLAHWVVNL